MNDSVILIQKALKCRLYCVLLGYSSIFMLRRTVEIVDTSILNVNIVKLRYKWYQSSPIQQSRSRAKLIEITLTTKAQQVQRNSRLHCVNYKMAIIRRSQLKQE